MLAVRSLSNRFMAFWEVFKFYKFTVNNLLLIYKMYSL